MENWNSVYSAEWGQRVPMKPDFETNAKHTLRAGIWEKVRVIAWVRGLLRAFACRKSIDPLRATEMPLVLAKAKGSSLTALSGMIGRRDGFLGTFVRDASPEPSPERPRSARQLLPRRSCGLRQFSMKLTRRGQTGRQHDRRSRAATERDRGSVRRGPQQQYQHQPLAVLSALCCSIAASTTRRVRSAFGKLIVAAAKIHPFKQCAVLTRSLRTAHMLTARPARFAHDCFAQRTDCQ
jgi:hypothetical protein